MDFRLTEEQELIRKNVREFAEKNIDPIAAEIDENSRHPVELFRKLAAGGWMGIPLPRRIRGRRRGLLTHAIVVEEIARSCSSTGFTLSFHAGIIGTALEPLRKRGAEEEISRPSCKRGTHGCLYADGAASRHRRHGRRHHRRARRARLCDRRDENLRVQRPPGRHVHPVLLDGPIGGTEGDERVHRPEGIPGA